MIICDAVYEYLEYCEEHPEELNDERKKLIKNIIKPLLKRDDFYFDEEKYDNFMKFTSRNYYPLFLYQKFVFAFVFVYHKWTKTPVFRKFVIEMGRGNGKDGMMMPMMHYLLTPMHGIQKYNIDIVANGKEQASDSYKIVYDTLESDKVKWKKTFKWNLNEATCLATMSRIKHNTSNPKTKDGKSSGAILFNEYHQYENYEQIDVFESQQGKVEHPRIFIITTNGTVRDGPLDDLLEQCNRILETGENPLGVFPFICKLNNEEEVNDEKNWIKANPSLPYRPVLYEEIKKQYVEATESPIRMNNFMTKRMNLPRQSNEAHVTDWDNIAATNVEFDLDDMIRKSNKWVVGIDFTKLSDMASVTFLTKYEDKYYVVQKNILDKQSKDYSRIRAPVEAWESMGQLKLIDDVEVNPLELTSAIRDMQSRGMNIVGIACDNFRFALLRNALESDLGVDVNDRKFLKMLRPSDILKIQPVIDSAFNLRKIIAGDNPVFRWATNNTKLVPKDKGNFEYGKIEFHARKTDPFMSFVHAMCMSELLVDVVPVAFHKIKVYKYKR